MIIFAIDPGTEQSALVSYDADRRKPLSAGTSDNATILNILSIYDHRFHTDLVIEEFESFGMAVGRESLKTVWWTGRFFQEWQPHNAHMLPRKNVKSHLCHNTRATDSNIRAAIHDLFGGKLAAVGNKRMPGPLYGIKGHEYAALAVALTFAGHGEA